MSRLNQLLEAYISAKITPKELEEFADLVSKNEEEVSLYIHELLASDQFGNTNDLVTEERIYSRIASLRENITEPATHRVHFLRRGFFKYAAAIIVLFGIGAYLWKTNIQQETTSNQKLSKADVTAPQIEKPIITLANGRVISLDSVAVGLIATEGQVNIEKLNDGRIVYHGMNNQQVGYNTITVPRGSKIVHLTLSDGTRVYLNTASTLRYPVAFTGNERRIEVSGEVYLEVAKDKNKRFIVENKGVITEVLGTSFNINGYSDEADSKITLLDGSVKVSSGNEKIIIKPGEQVEAKNNQELRLNQGVNISEVTAWQKGKFLFTQTDLNSILKQISRWYDVKVINKSKVSTRTFSGGLSRKSPLSEVVAILKSNGVNCTIDGSTLLIDDK